MMTTLCKLFPIPSETATIFFSLTPFGSYLGISVDKSSYYGGIGVPVFLLMNKSGSNIRKFISSLILPWDIIAGSEKFT